MEKEKIFWGAISQFEKFGAKRMQKLMAHFRNPEDLLSASRRAIIYAGLEEKLAGEFVSWRGGLDVNKFTERVHAFNIKILLPGDAEYPALLREINDPPQTLFCRGNLGALRKPLAVVGTRKMTNYGRQAAEKIIAPLSSGGISVVSGLALGIDAVAHATALKAGGHTVAVLGSGIDDPSIYPSTNKMLAKEIIAAGGAMISEFPPGTPSLKHHFPIRNRIIAGMSLGTLVVEADIDSGSLITARCALDENRDVFAVPGDIFRNSSRGSNNLIKMGARAIDSAEEVAAILGVQIIDAKNRLPFIPESPEEAALLLCLKKDPLHIDALAKESRLDISTVSATLTLLEMKGAVRHLGGMNYALTR